MDLSSIAGSIPLVHGSPLRVQNSLGRRISVLEGHVWVTQDGDPRDIVLSAGDDFLFDRPTAALISALGGDARIAGEDGLAFG
jgi:ferric-dicitrate binding protein FerR (iron transport regulator)